MNVLRFHWICLMPLPKLPQARARPVSRPGLRCGHAALAVALLLLAFLSAPAAAQSARTPLEAAQQADAAQYASLLKRVDQAFHRLEPQVVHPAKGYLRHPYLVPAGYYQDLWDWDGFFIGYHLANQGSPEYLKWWVLNFARAVDAQGYVPGRITTTGPSPVLGDFQMKPFLAQGALIAAERLHDFSWIEPVYGKLKAVLAHRKATRFDRKYGLYYWADAMESGVDNSAVLSNDPARTGSILAVDLNTWQLREYLAMARIAARTGHADDAAEFAAEAEQLRGRMMRYLWFPADHSFFNIRRDTGEPIKVASFQNFIPLVQGLLPRKEGRAMIDKYLWNEAHMLSPFGLRSLSRQSPDYSNENMIVPYSNWRGPIWIVANYLYSVALAQYGYDAEARELSYMMGTLVLKDIAADGSMHEDYDAENGAPLAPDIEQARARGRAVGFVGWDLLVQDMLEGAVRGTWHTLRIPDAPPAAAAPPVRREHGR